MNSNQQNNKAKNQSGFFKYLFFLALIVVVIYQTDPTTATAHHITVESIKQYWGYGDETTVIDCSACSTLSETGMKIKTALKSCPKRILLWNGTFSGNSQDYAPLYSCFWVDCFSSCNNTVDGIPVGIIEMSYSVTDPNAIARMQAEIDAAAWEILAKCPGDGDIFGDCLVIHDELIKRITYDRSLSFPHIYDIYGALVNGKAVCQGGSDQDGGQDRHQFEPVFFCKLPGLLLFEHLGPAVLIDGDAVVRKVGPVRFRKGIFMVLVARIDGTGAACQDDALYARSPGRTEDTLRSGRSEGGLFFACHGPVPR